MSKLDLEARMTQRRCRNRRLPVFSESARGRSAIMFAVCDPIQATAVHTNRS